MTGRAGAAEDPDLARARRQFIREHHPDRGGDARAFAAGLAAYNTVSYDPQWSEQHGGARVTVVRRPRGVRRLIEPVQKRLHRRRHPRVH